MNTNMKKAVAGVVLGTFAFGVATPAFASVNNAVAEDVVYAEQTEAVVTEPYMTSAMAEPVVEERGKAKVALDIIKRVILDNWDDIPLLKNYNGLKNALLEALSAYYEVSDTVEDVLRDSISSVFGVDRDGLVCAAAVFAIMALLPI